MPEYRIAAIPGDGIGAEVVAAGLEVLAEQLIKGQVLNCEFRACAAIFPPRGKFTIQDLVPKLRVG